MKALTRLAALTKSEPDIGLLMAYADSLEDVHPRGLELAFIEFERTWKIPALPTPGEIRECADAALQRERRREREDREHATREEWRQAAAAGQTMTFADFVRKLRVDRPDLVCLAERISIDDRPPRTNAMISTREGREDRYGAYGAEFLLQLERRARAEGWPWWPAYVERTRNRVSAAASTKQQPHGH